MGGQLVGFGNRTPPTYTKYLHFPVFPSATVLGDGLAVSAKMTVTSSPGT